MAAYNSFFWYVMPYSADNPIHRMSNSDFALLVEQTLFPATGGRDQMSHQRNEDGSITTTHPRRRGGERVKVEAEASPDDPLGPPKSMVAGLTVQHTPEGRKAHGMKPTLSGGITGSFGEMHQVFLQVGRHFGRALAEKHLGNDAAQKERIGALIAQWSDHLPAKEKRELSWQDTGDHADKLAVELASLKKVPVTLNVDGKPKVFEVDNVRIGLENAPLAHVMFAVGKNAISLTARPLKEIKFITQGVANFHRVLKTTDEVYDYLKTQLEKQGVENADTILKDSKLGFDSKRAEELLMTHLPLLQLSDVISQLAGGERLQHVLSPLVAAVGETMPEIPLVRNAEHGARLLEALLYRIADERDHSFFGGTGETGETAKKLGLDTKEIKRFLRASAAEAPFDVAHLREHEGVRKLLAIAEQETGYNEDIKRGLAAFEAAVESQKELAGSRKAASKALLYQPGWVERASSRLSTGKAAERKSESNVLKAIDSGMNGQEMQAMVEEILHIMSHDAPSAGKGEANFSTLVKEQMDARARRVHKDVPPLP